MTDDVASAPPASGPGCVECDESGGWWFHLRRCVSCGHVGCCDSSPSQHATAHFRETGHPVIRSYEPGADWYWDYAGEGEAAPVAVPPPLHHPIDQTAPGPADRVPADWRSRLHA
jgi:hypothetical protein